MEGRGWSWRVVEGYRGLVKHCEGLWGVWSSGFGCCYGGLWVVELCPEVCSPSQDLLYLPALLCSTTPTQKTLAEASKPAYQSALAGSGKKKAITTEILDCPPFYYAEDYHQQYLSKPGSRPYCSAMPTGVSLPPFSEWAPKDLAGEAPKLPDEYWAKHGPRPGCVIREPNQPIQFP